MSLTGHHRGGEGDGFPRVSGDEPTFNAIKQYQEEFSPRERG